MNNLSEEFIPACWVCGKVWQRKDSNKWLFFNDMVVCRNHPGAKEWYNGALILAEEKYKLHLK